MSDLIEINVETTYLSSESNPDENKYYFLYTVLIKNNSPKKTKLLSRHWVIKDDNGKIQVWSPFEQGSTWPCGYSV